MKRILTGVKPTWDKMHLWNYFGAILPMINLQEKYSDSEVILFIANMHALTQVHDSKQLYSNTINLLKFYIASWLNLENTIIFKSSNIPGHSQLAWIFACITNLWYMERMHAYKDALAKWKLNEINIWTLTYPILMASDILLYDADIVPVWKDQKQHLEYARDMAERFNNKFWNTFKIPEPYIQKDVATIIWTDWRKMSKSYNNYIWMIEDEKVLLKKIKQIPTDMKTVEESKDPDECNVYNLLKLFLTNTENDELRKRYIEWWLSYKYVKDFLYEKILEFIKNIEKKYNSISDEYIEKILNNGEQSALEISTKKISDIYKKVWF